MPAMKIQRSIIIDARLDKVFSYINDFNKWTEWSPWLIMEPEAIVTVADDAKSYEWKGDRVGEGNMKILEELKNECIYCELNFLKPWKSSAKTGFQLHDKEGKTEVTWTMNSSLPFFLFWMTKSMEAYVGADYERGLNMLKALIEKGHVPSQLTFEGTSLFDGCKWIGIRDQSSMEDIGAQMKTNYGRLQTIAEENKNLIGGNAFSVYHRWNILKGSVDYTASLPVKEIPSSLSDGIISGEIPSMEVYKLKHTGSYNHLGNAWSTVYTMIRNKEFKHRKGMNPFEVYLNNPQETSEKDLITVIHYPIR